MKNILKENMRRFGTKNLTESQQLSEAPRDDTHMIAEELDPKTWLERLATDLNNVWETYTGTKLVNQPSTVVVSQPGPNELYTINLPSTTNSQGAPYVTVLLRSIMSTQHGVEAQKRHAQSYGNSLFNKIGDTNDKGSYARNITLPKSRDGNLQLYLKRAIRRWVAAYQKKIAEVSQTPG